MRRLGIGSYLSGNHWFAFVCGSPARAPRKRPSPSASPPRKTGKLNVEAIRQINGLNLWVEQVNKAGGIKLADGTMVKVATKFMTTKATRTGSRNSIPG